MLLQQPVKAPPLVLIEDLIHPRLAVRDDDTVILPHVVQDGPHLLRLLRGQVQFLLDAGEIRRFSRRSAERRLMQSAVRAQVHRYRAGGRTAQENESERYRAGELWIPRPREREIRAHSSSG